MTPKFMPVLEMCIDNGLSRGWHRAHKHNANPDERSILNEQATCIIGELYEWFDFTNADLSLREDM